MQSRVNGCVWILAKESDVRAIQVNMADEKLVVDFPADSYGDDRKTRHIETRPADLPLHGGDQCERSELDDCAKMLPASAPTATTNMQTASVPGTSG